MAPTPPRELPPKQKLAVELGPLLIFFVSYFVAKRFGDEKSGIMWATGAFVVATLLALVSSYRVERRVQPMTLVTAVLVVVLGGLTLYLDDETFIKRKPTLVSGLMGCLLLGGLAFGRALLQPLMNSTLHLTDEGWRKLTLRWGFFFLTVAGVNELVWRNVSTDTWLQFKLFGILAMTFVFLMLQAPLIQRHSLEAPGGARMAPQEDDKDE